MSEDKSIAPNRFVQGVSNKEYHKKTLGVVSNSALKQFNRAPAAYRWWIDAPPDEPTPAMEFGSLVHCLVLEPDLFAKTYVVPPDFGNLRTNQGKADKAAWLAQNLNVKMMEQEDFDRACRMRDSLLAHTDARAIIERSQHEVSGFWTCPQTGLICKIRADCWMPDARIFGDLKTCIDASEDEFAKAVVNFGYHQQAALYCMGAEHISLSDTYADFVFVVVEKQPPFLVATYTLNRADLNAKIFAVAADMARFKQCVDEDSWPAFGLRTKEISLPRWAK